MILWMKNSILNVENTNFIMGWKFSTMEKIKTNLDLDLYLSPDSASYFH